MSRYDRPLRVRLPPGEERPDHRYSLTDPRIVAQAIRESGHPDSEISASARRVLCMIARDYQALFLDHAQERAVVKVRDLHRALRKDGAA